MSILFGVIASFGALYAWLIWQIAGELDAEEERQQLELIESVGGEDSPWINPNLSTQTHVDTSHIPDMVRVYPQSQMPRSVPESVPEPVPMSQGLNHVTPMVSADATPKNNTDVGGVEGWLERNAVHFPLEVPPENITSDAGLNALNEAREWIKKALNAGVSKRKIITEMFGASYGTNKASKRINQIIREVQC